MTISVINTNTQLINPYTFDDSSTFAIVHGPFKSLSDISITAKNILIAGNITANGTIKLSAKNIFVLGVIQADELRVYAKENRYNGINDETLDALQKEGLSLTHDRASNRILNLHVLP